MKNNTNYELREMSDDELLKLLYKRQDKYLEDIPKFIDDRQLGLLLEHWMDVMREFRKLSRKGNPSKSYMIEKLYRSLKRLKRKDLIDNKDIDIICEKAKDNSFLSSSNNIVRRD